MLRLASKLACKVRFLNNNFQPACCTWSRPYFCSFRNWILKCGKYSECEAALSKALITELLKEHYTIDAVANFDTLCHGVRIAIDREGNVLGIDLGTTHSRVAVMQGEDPVLIEEVEGDGYNKKTLRSVPSVVFFKPNGELWVGRQANMMTSLYPSRALFDTKHLVGTVYDSSKVQTSLYPKIVRGFKGEAWVETEFGIFSPAKIQAFILAKMRAIAEVYLKESAIKAVISVPACFNEAQREAIKYAGDIAGLDIQGVVEDPVAAALAYGLDKRDGLFAVYSFGGTFEFSILEISNGVIKVKAKRKSLSHGGLDFDLLLVRHLLKEFTRCHAFDASHHPLVLQRFLGAAERAKVSLSSEPQVEVQLHNLLNIRVKKSLVRKDLEVRITRSEFESLVSELIKETGAICQKCLEVANITRKDVDDILVVGGLGCVPSVREYVELFFGKSPLRSPIGMTPDEAVVIGAAIHGEKFR